MVHSIRWVLLGWLFLLICPDTQGQIYLTREGNITFYSNAPLEKIEAHNHNVSSVINLENGQIEFAVLIKAFQFKKALMQQHFNENYLESDQYPKATFKGTFQGFTNDNLTQHQAFNVEIQGTLLIHGQSREIEALGILHPGSEGIKATSSFVIDVADYEIKIPKIVRNKIAKQVTIEVDLVYTPMESN